MLIFIPWLMSIYIIIFLKTDRHDIIDIFLEMALSAIIPTLTPKKLDRFVKRHFNVVCSTTSLSSSIQR